MKKIFNQLLEIPNFVNQKVLNTKVNSAVESFDGEHGIRCYVKTIYQFLALVTLVVMEISLLRAGFAYLTDAHSLIEKAGSIITLVLLMYSAFPIAQVIKSRGETLGGTHNGMISFVFNDFVKTNIRIVGEVLAIAGLFAAFATTLSFITDHNLFSTGGDMDLLKPLVPVFTFPAETFSTLLNAVGLKSVAEGLQSITGYRMAAASQFNGDFIWSAQDLVGVVGSYVNVALGLIGMYISLAIYQYLYSIGSNLINWAANPSLPISVKNK
ncbi:MAG: hypothetical protein NT153_00455 [Bacteroidetes bacterium]|nr:hypothetical protein [Bacteroidota bacterium]